MRHHRSAALRTRSIGTILLLVWGLAACSSGGGPLVEGALDSGAAPLPVELVEVGGGRDGATTRATFLFRGGADTELFLNLLVAYDPQPVLTEGTWRYTGPTGRGGGPVRAESVRFVGGQGEGASVGGVFLLEEGGRSRFRVRLPLHAVGGEGWSVEEGR